MNDVLRHLSANLVKKYDIGTFGYTEYPHKSFWSEEFNDKDFRFVLRNLFLYEKDSPITLYVHIPFCEQRCYFCICHTEIIKDYEKVKNYLNNSLYREIGLFRKFFDENSFIPNFQEIYFGGGSPTILHEKEFDQLLENVLIIADIKNIKQFTIEIDPRRVTKEKLKYYHSKGVNKISIGIQDFDPEVQATVNRIQSPELIENLLTPDIRECFDSINFDIICGLPKQTIHSIKKTVDRVVQMSPDRISFTYMHYAPQYAKHHLLMRRDDIPNIYERRMLFHEAIKTFINNGYVCTGFEYFAKPTDDVAKALEKRTVHYSALGATQGRCDYTIGIGRQSYSTIGNYYFQNVYEQINYETIINNGKFPIYRGYKLDNDDIIRRYVIQTLRTYLFIDCQYIEKRYNIKFKEYFKKELYILNEFSKDGLLDISEKMIILTDLGKYFTTQVCSIFDKFIRTD